jgi:2-polyprenyl-6-methoxyphenol hydroxylase-like FAD-dependent oxidoreductase
MSSATPTDVLVVGAGPGGLMLASELALAGVNCTVLERREHHSRESRALGLQARTLELLELRGLADRFLARGHALDHFRLTVGPARIDLTCLDTNFQQLNICPQSLTEQLLEERARELGATVERGAEVVGVRQDAGGVTATVRRGDEEWEERAGWLVGCDGTRSVVRQSAGIDYPGKTYPYNVIVGDVKLARPPDDGMLVEVSRSGLVVAIDFGNGWWRMGVVNHATPRPHREPVSVAELDTALTEIFGRELGLSDPLWTTRFSFQCRQAATYRKDRLFLLGDAAHVHAPLGAQGLNLSMQDAMNLGWKLAAVIRDGAPEAVLDSYEAERRPRAGQVLAATDRAIRVMMSTRPPVRALRRLVVPRVTGFDRSHQFLAGQVSGIGIAIPPRDGRRHAAVVGTRLPDVPLRRGGDGTASAFSLFRTGRFVLIDQTPDGGLADAAADWGDQVVTARARIAEDRPELARYGALLYRPDGYCAWAGRGDDVLALRSALREWCGEPRHETVVAS